MTITRSSNANKAHGWDGISIRMIKLYVDALILPLKLIFENCLSQGNFPEIGKKGNVVPNHKKNDKKLKQIHRPISLLPLFSKILEKLIFDAVYQHLNTNCLLNPNQSDFRPGDSTVNQLLSITHSIFLAFDCNPTLDVHSVFLDISKPFDCVWHEGLMYKLSRNGVSGKLLLLLTSFLSNRKQCTIFNGRKSRWGSVKDGVPQGSVLGPLLFLVYMNDVTSGLICSSKLFADNITIFTTVYDTHKAAADLNHDLILVNLWARKWRMSFNPDIKSKQLR